VKKPSLNTDILSDLEAYALKSSAMINVANATVLAPVRASTDVLKKNPLPLFVSYTRNEEATHTKIATA
jgi:hypothetical protein